MRTLTLSHKNRIKIIRGLLEYKTEEEIAQSLNIKANAITSYCSRGIIPKKKHLLSFLACHALGTLPLCFPNKEIKTALLSEILNSNGVRNQCSKSWSRENLRQFLKSKGITMVRNKGIKVSDLKDLSPDKSDFYSLFHITPHELKIDDYLKTLSFNKESVPVEIPQISEFVSQLYIPIATAIKNGAENIGEVTNYLNDNGYRNQSGKPFGRWSVTLIMEKLQLKTNFSKISWGNREQQYLIDKIANFNKNRRITDKVLNSWVSELKSSNEIIVKKKDLIKSVRHLVSIHNKKVTENLFHRKWFAKIDYAVNITFRHKRVSFEELAKHFGVCTMTIHRVVKKLEYDILHQYFLRFKSLYNAYLDQTKGSEWSSVECAKWFNNTYLQSERGSDWTYLIVQYSIDKLHQLEDEGIYGEETSR